MKKLLSTFLLFSFLLSFSQQSIAFENGTFKEILAKAKKEKKLVFLDAYASWCGPCKLMEKNIFTLPAVKAYYDANFINARFDMEKGEGREIAAKYSVRSYPSFLFLNGDGELVMQNFGYMGEADFLTIAKEANNPKLAGNSMVELFNKGEKDPEFLLNFMKRYAESDYELAKKGSERYFAKKTTAEFTRDEVGLLLYFLKSPSDANYQIFKAKKDQISKILSPEIYQQFDANIKISKVMENSLDQKTGLIDDQYFFKNAIPLIGQKDAETALARMKVIYYENIGNFPEYEKAALIYYKNADDFDPQELLQPAWNFAQHVENKDSLKKAQEWAEKSVMKGETPENTYILARIYAKNGKKTEAKTYAELSKNLSDNQGKDASLATELLKSLK